MELTRTATGDEYFQDAWATSDDPWEHATRWYEQRKYNLTVAALPRRRYERSFEPGCGTGVLTRLVARRSAEHLAMERHPRGVRATAQRCGDLPNVTVAQGTIPEDWPPGRFDLIVLSEVLYYLDEPALVATLARCRVALEPNGHLLAVHYRPTVHAHAWTGNEVHRLLLDQPGWEHHTRITDPEFLLDVLAT